MSPEHPGRPGKPAGKFGRALAEARQRAGLSQAQAALVIGVDRNTVARWERAEVRPVGGQLYEDAVLAKIRGA